MEAVWYAAHLWFGGKPIRFKMPPDDRRCTTSGRGSGKAFLEALAQKTLDGNDSGSSWQAEEVNGAVRVRVTAACEETDCSRDD